MARLMDYPNGGDVTIFKFKETGIVALCAEVTDFVGHSSTPDFKRLDFTKAYFRETDENYEIIFPAREGS
jgi:hypothetical protein